MQSQFRLVFWLTATILLFTGGVVLAGTFYVRTRMQAALAVDHLTTDLYALRATTLEYMNAPSERISIQWHTIYQNVAQNQKSPDPFPRDVADAFTNIKQLFERIAELTGQPDPSTNRNEFKNRLYFALLSDTQRIVDWTQRQRNISVSYLKNTLQYGGIAFLFSVTTIVLFTGFILMTAGRRIVCSIAELEKGASTISKGELDHTIALSGTDEFGELASVFNTMTEDLRNLYTRINHTNRSLRTLSDCNQVLVRSEDETALLNDIVKILVQESHYDFCRIALVQPDGMLETVAQYGTEKGYLACIGEYSFHAMHEPVIVSFRMGQRVIVQEIPTTSDSAPWSRTAIACGFRSVLALPLVINKNTIGSMGFYSAEINPFSDDEISLLEELTGDISYGISTLRDRVERIQTKSHLTQLAAAVEQAADDIIIANAEGIITYVNPAFERTTGFTASEVIGRTVALLESGKTDPATIRDMWATLQEGKIWQGRFVNRTRDGREIIQEANISAFHDASGAYIGFVAAQRDITDKLKNEQRMEQSQRLEAIGTLAGGIAHDFNNILAAITGYTELAMSKASTSEQQEDLASVLTASRRAADLVSQILTFSRLNEQESKPISLAPIVKEVMKLLRASIPTTIKIISHITSTAAIIGNPIEIHRLLVNLCTNAAHAMADQGGQLEVTLDDYMAGAAFLANYPATRHGAYIRLQIKDTGCGMSAEIKSRIFDPFFTTRKKDGGTGMGLSVVHGIVSSLNGVITVESEQGIGSNFQIYLPVAVVQEPEPDIRDNSMTHSGKEHILLVDDEDLIVNALKHTLERIGYHVTAFTKSMEALETFLNNPDLFDLLVTDMTMPEITGDILAAKVHNVKPEMPVILCTGYSEKINAEKAKAMGINGFLLKPFETAQFTKMIRSVLNATSE